MVSFSPDFSSLTKFANLFSSSGGRSTQSLSKVDVQSQTQTGLSIVTAEGDKVTLSTNASFQGTGVKYNARGVTEGQAIYLRSNALEGSFSSEKSITIEGDLNEQEIQDIKNIVNQVNGLRQDVASGDIDAAVTNGQQIAAKGSIASVNVNIQHSESVSTEKVFLRQRVDAGEGRAYPSGAVNNGSQGALTQGASSLGFLDALFNSQGRGTSTKEESSSIRDSDDSPIHDKESIGGLEKFLNAIEEKIQKGARRIADLANRLHERVEKQADKIAQSFEKLSDAVAEGRTGKADRLRNKIDRQINGLANTTDKIGSKIERTSDKLTNVIGKLADRFLQSSPHESEPLSSPTSQSEESSPIEGDQPVTKQVGDT